MIIDGGDGLNDYGRLISCGELPDNFTALSAYVPGEGLLVLEAQQRVLRFLLNCCEQILKISSLDDVELCYSSNQPRSPYFRRSQHVGFESLLLVETAEAPYRLPLKTDFDFIESLLSSTLSKAIHHIWMLREDPTYLRNILEEIKDHQPAAWQEAADENNEGNPSLQTKGEKIFTARGCKAMASEMYYRLEFFTEFHKQSQVLSQLHKQHAATLHHSKELPEEFKHAIVRFLFYGHRILSYLLSTLLYSVTNSRPWRRFFVLKPSDKSSGFDAFKVMKTPRFEAFEITRIPGVDMNGVQKRAIALLHALGRCCSSTTLLRHLHPVEDFAKFLDSTPEAHHLITNRVADILGDVALVSYCIVQIFYFLPWSREFDMMLNDMDGALTNELCQRKDWSAFEGVDEKSLRIVAKSADLNLSKFVQEKPSANSAVQAKRLSNGEKSLDAFWTTFDKVVFTKCGSLEGSPYRDVFSHSRVMRRTTDWDASTKRLVYLYKPLSTIYVDESAEDEGTHTAEADMTKPKPAPIGVDKRSLRIFKVLLYSSSDNTKNHMKWNDFRHAMTSSGLFTEVKFYPFLRLFKRTGGQGGYIQFPEYDALRQSVPKLVQRVYGRRLAWEFGWEDTHFVLDEYLPAR